MIKDFRIDNKLMTNYLKRNYLDKEFPSNNYGPFKVLGLHHTSIPKNKLFVVEFIETGFQSIAGTVSINKGKIKDKLVPTWYGVGYLGYATMKGDCNRYLYSVWTGMLRRCYDSTDQAYHNYGGRGVTVCKRWHRFEYFLEDYKNLPGYEKDVKKELDKDGVLWGSKVYCPENCRLVTKADNLKTVPSKQKHYKLVSPEGRVYYKHNQREIARDLIGCSAMGVSKAVKRAEAEGVAFIKGWSLTIETATEEVPDYMQGIKESKQFELV